MLFAIVLLASALATSLSEPAPEKPDKRSPALREPAAPVEQDPPDEPAQVRFDASRPTTARRRVVRGSRAVVTVPVPVPGDVEIPDLGLVQAAAPGTPAIFDIVPLDGGDHEVRFRPVKGEPRTVGILVASAPAAG